LTAIYRCTFIAVSVAISFYMIIKFLLRNGKIVDNHFRFGKEKTDQNNPYYFRLKILQLNNEFIKFIENYRKEKNLDPKNLRENFFIPFVKEIQEDSVRLVNYEEELYEELLERDIDIKELQELLREKFQNLHFYKKYSKSFNGMAFVELLLFGVIRVVPGKPLIDITREFDENGPSVHIHIRNNVKLNDIIKFVKKNYKKKISKTLNYENINKKDKFRIRKERDIKILNLYTKDKFSLAEIAEKCDVDTYYAEDTVKSVLRRMRKHSRE